MPLSPHQRQHTEQQIRAAIDRLLSGQVPSGGGCDAKTLAHEAGISRAALYRTYSHLKHEFERRRRAMLDAGDQPDPREQRIAALRERNSRLTGKLTATHTELRELRNTHRQALSALAAADDTIQRLHRQLADAHRSIPRQENHTPNLIPLPLPDDHTDHHQ